MCTTRSPCRPAPATRRDAAPVPHPGWAEAELILVAHGSASDPRPNRSLARHAEALADRRLFAGVRFGALFGEPTAATVAASRADRPAYVVPMFMCDGYYTRTVIPDLFADEGARDRNGAAPIRFCRPVGEHSALADILLDRAERTAQDAGLAPADSTLLLIGHGSRGSQASYAATRAHLRRAARRGAFKAARMALLEQSPTLPWVLRRLDGPLVAAGLFAADGAHAAADVPEALADYDGGPVVYLGAIGTDPAIAALVLDNVAACDAAVRR